MCYGPLEVVQKNMESTNYAKEKIHYVNVDETDNKTHDLLTKAGFEIVAKQYEMALSLHKK